MRTSNAALLAGLLATPAAAQSLDAFSARGQSTVNYGLAAARPQMSCAALLKLADPEVTMLSAMTVAAAGEVPEHCRVGGLIAPEIRFEINLPAAWNRRFYMFGNGGFAGENPETPPKPVVRANALRSNFVTAFTNTGHEATREPLASFAQSGLPKVIDYAFRAVHLTAQTGRRIAQAYYDRPVAYSYFDGCSTGGRQGLMSAQRFPEDFDGILDGAPVLDLVDTSIGGLWNGRALAEAPVTLEKMKTVAAAVDAKCDAIDGLKDGLIDDPRRCSFDPASDVAQCAAGDDGPTCLTPAQAEAIRKVHDGPRSNGKPYFFGFAVGSEAVGTPATYQGEAVSGWDRWLIGRNGGMPLQLQYGDSFVKYLAFGRPDPSRDWKTFDFDKDPARTTEIRALLDATDPNLGPLRSRGGKILMYHGWADPALTPYMSIDYYDRARAANGPDTESFFRLFMVPGMAHCRGGVATDRFDGMTPLIDWVENGIAPRSIVAARIENGKTVRTRPLCPYPQVAGYAGSGSIDEATNFVCRAPE